MPNVYATNKTSSPITVSSWTVYFIDSTDAEIVEVQDGNNVKYNAFKYTLQKNISNTAVLSVISNREVWTVTLTDTDYASFSGTLHVILKGVIYSNSAHTASVRVDYEGDASFVSGIATIDKGLYGQSYYGSSVEQHDIPNNTPYWYVIDGEHDTWTDDLSEWGYSEVPVGPVLPTVTIYSLPSTYCAFDSGGSSVTISAGNSRNMVYYWTGNQYSAITYDSTKSYSLISYRNSGTLIGRTGFSCFKYHDIYSPSSYLGVTNVSSQSITVDAFDYAVCSDSTATVVTVYNASNVAYNAFKFTANNTDYYYVLDGTQTDWTDDLAGIGYSLTPSGSIEIWFALNASQSNATFGANDYWGSFVIDNSDKSLLQSFGVTLTQVTVDGVAYDAISWSNSLFSFTPIGLYEGIRTNSRNADMNNFRCAAGPAGSSVYYPQICIWSTNAFSSICKTWKCRITRIL